ncbi:structure-specific endonuclease subunit slx1 [Cinnamomum micranthum f. kanehirae]|uniref:Structure-specific endonuclease subunit slx1 n=1 Tax=Cinnamomum micranthum f. kanehirae TaxID=337451 RepID=A0A3S4PWR1_9MAGN|nr:structure-specific endonuclease subunit slx1 [Cinnamomum micranthum f. kanehirae]
MAPNGRSASSSTVPSSVPNSSAQSANASTPGSTSSVTKRGKAKNNTLINHIARRGQKPRSEIPPVEFFLAFRCKTYLQKSFDIDIHLPHIERAINKYIGQRLKEFRCMLHVYYKSLSNDQRRRKPYVNVAQEDWERLCDWFETDKFKKLSTVNKAIRAKKKVHHCGGSRSFLNHRADKDKMLKMQAESLEEGSTAMTEEDIANKVLGTKPGYIVGLGHGVDPMSSSSSYCYPEVEELRRRAEAAETQAEEHGRQAQELRDEVHELQNWKAASEAKLNFLMAHIGANFSVIDGFLPPFPSLFKSLSSKGLFVAFSVFGLESRKKSTIEGRRLFKKINSIKGPPATEVWNYPLQFEWARQHPRESLAVRKVAASFKSLSGIANKIKLAYTMLTLPAWENLNLTINFFSTKYMKYTAGYPTLPQQKNVQFGSMDDLPCYMGSQILDQEEDFEEDEDCNEDELETNTMDISNREC